TEREIFAAKRFLFTLTGLIGSTLIQATAAELKEISKAVSVAVLQLLLRVEDGRRASGCQYESDVELLLLGLDSERRKKVSSVAEEDVFFRLVRVRTSSGAVTTRKLLAAQEAIGRAHTSAIVAYEGLRACGTCMSGFAASVLLLPVRARLSEFAESCEASGERLSEALVHASTLDRARDSCRETLDATLALIAAFED
ncbi:hypothetical protein FOZ63_019007, partial [Perkinsus olseni]